MDEVNHQRIKTNGIMMHVAEKGSGPLVLLLHGFPEFWYSWRHQISFLAKHGYHVVAPDLRGYGDSDAPLDPSSYTVLHLVGDLVALLDHFGEQQAFLVGHDTYHKAFLVGHDWGAIAGWNLCLMRPDRVKGFISISMPYTERSPNTKTIELYRQMFGEEFYVCQFQEPGRAERAFARYDCSTIMKKFLLIHKMDLLIAPPGMEYVDYVETKSVPPWITEEELQVYADKFQESGFTGAFNYYRAMDLNWELSAPWQGSKIAVPAKLIVGDKDIGFEYTKEYIQGDAIRTLIPNIEVVVLDGHHFIQQEKAEEVSNEILSFIHKLSAD